MYLFRSFAPAAAEGFVPGLILGVWRIQAEQAGTRLYLINNPCFQFFLFGCCLDNVVEERIWNDDSAIFINDDHVVWKHRDTTSTNRLLPVDKGKTGDRWRGRDGHAPYG